MLSNDYLNWINGKKENFPYISPIPKDAPEGKNFPIIASGMEYNYSSSVAIKEEVYHEAKECGMNVCNLSAVSWKKYLIENLEYADNANVNIVFRNNNFLTDPDFLRLLTEGEEFKNLLEHIGGFNSIDEPSLVVINGEKEFIKEKNGDKYFLPECYKTLLSQNPPFNLYINLVSSPDPVPLDPEYKNEAEKAAAEYLEFLQFYQDYYKPAFFSFDLYPITEGAKLLYEGINAVDNGEPTLEEGQVYVDSGRLFYNLQLFSEFSKKYNRPFWIYLQSMCHMFFDTVRFRPLALEQYLRFEAFTALAYGCKGMAYWTYAMRLNGQNDDGQTTEVYFSALLDRKGKKTASWYFAQKINEEVQKYSDIFLNGTIESVDKTDNKLFYFNNFIIGFLTETGSPDMEDKEDKDRNYIVVTKISHKNNTYFVIVNTDALNYHTLYINVQGNNIYELTPKTSKGEINTVLKKGDHERVLIPGGYRIFKTYLF